MRWSLLNTVQLLRVHKKALVALSTAMARRSSIGACLQTIENNLKTEKLKGNTELLSISSDKEDVS